MLDVKPGDLVMVTNVNFRPREARVAKIGRKNIFLVGNKTPFDNETGQSKDSYGHDQILTVYEYDLNKRVESARTALRKTGIELSYGLDKEKILKIFNTLRDADLLA